MINSNHSGTEQKGTMSKKEKKPKRDYKDYQKWYYETYTKKRRQNGAGSYGADWYKKKTPEEKAENRRKGFEKRRKTMAERYTKEQISEIYKDSGHRLAEYMKEHPEKRYRPTSEKAREMSALGAEAKRAKKVKRSKKDEQ